jgi:alpha-N-arabinofuranosidase
LVNGDAKSKHKIEIDTKDLGVKNFTAHIITSSKLQDFNSFENPNKISPAAFKDFDMKKGKLEINLPPFSVLVLEGK